MSNKNLAEAKRNKQDEFYTMYEDIEVELVHYKQHFKDKVIYCNCDDPNKSNFFKYFVNNFNELCIRKLIATCYSQKSVSNLFFSESAKTKALKAVVTDPENIEITELESNGDFASSECLESLKESDIVVTNPPFSLFSKFILQMVKYGKKFLAIGSTNALTYKPIFSMFQKGDIWLGINRPSKFITDYDSGEIAKFGNVVWYTNLDHDAEQDFIDLNESYNPDTFIKYQNCDLLHIETLSDIPYNYDGLMSVPITILEKFNHEQFDLVGLTHIKELMPTPVQLGKDFVDLYRSQGGTGHFSENMYGVWYIDESGKARVPYGHVVIRHKIR